MIIALLVKPIIQLASRRLPVASGGGKELFYDASHTGMAADITACPGDRECGRSIVRLVQNEVIEVKVPGGPVYQVLLQILQE